MYIHPMELLKQELNFILDILPPNSKIAYLDYPVHGNIGDLLIMKGTEKFFDEHNIRVMCRYSFYDFPLQIRFPRDTILVFHGGGNLGDLYHGPQEMREYFIQKFKNHRIVILPQTIYFQSLQNLERVSQIFRLHPNLHIFTRDTRSFQVAKKHLSDKTYLIPDMAHALWPILTPKSLESKSLYLLRKDIEKCKETFLNLNVNNLVMDWNDLFTRYDNKAIRILIKMHRMNRKIHILPTRFLWYIFSQYLITKSIKHFSKHSYVLTSRLHGHILACLMNKPNSLIDNSYSKNYMYFKTWTYKVPYAKVID